MQGSGVRASELAEVLGVSQARVSQYVAEGKLDGCFVEVGRSRRFDVAKVAAALGKRLDPGQALGNGRATRARLAVLQAAPVDDGDLPDLPPRRQKTDARLLDGDATAYEMARTQIAIEAARKARRENALHDGTLVLASAVERSVAQALGQELRAVQTMLGDAAQALADDLGVDSLAARKVLMDCWRAHRSKRAEEADVAADVAQAAPDEKAANF